MGEGLDQVPARAALRLADLPPQNVESWASGLVRDGWREAHLQVHPLEHGRYSIVIEAAAEEFPEGFVVDGDKPLSELGRELTASARIGALKHLQLASSVLQEVLKERGTTEYARGLAEGRKAGQMQALSVQLSSHQQIVGALQERIAELEEQVRELTPRRGV